MSHSIRYLRPETRASVARIFVPDGVDAAKQIRRLQGLGYTILDVSPPPVAVDGASAPGEKRNGTW